MKKYLLKYIILLSILFWFIGCGEANGSNISTLSENDSNIEIETKRSLIDAKQKEFYMEFEIKSKYQEGVISKLTDISLDLNACVISRANLNIPNNGIEFDKPYQSYNVELIAEFAKPCLPTGYTISAKKKLIYKDTSNKGLYNSGFLPIEIDGNITKEDTTTIFDYGIVLRSADNEPRIKLNSKKRYKLFLLKLDNNETIREDRIHNITIRSSDPSKVKLIDPNNYLIDNSKPKDELTFSKMNGIDLYIQTYTTSGIAYFNITANYTNNRGEIHDINSTLSLVISSGEPTAFSINSTGVEYNFETKWFEQKFLISASDKYNNVVNIPSKITVSAMADFTRDSRGNRILYGKFSKNKASLIADSDTHFAILEARGADFSKVDGSRDFLYLFGDITAYEALGKWDIDPYNDNKIMLELTDSYYGSNHDKLGFAVGHNYYNEICSSESKEWELKVDSSDGTYQLDKDGQTYMTLKFPAYMIGKKIALGVNFSGAKKRSGEVHFETLHSFQGVKVPEDIILDVNATPISKTIYFEVDTGTEDRFWVKNAKVVCDTESENVVVSRFTQNKEITRVEDCKGSENGEVAYWNLQVRLLDVNKSGFIKFNECQVSSFIDEF